MIDVNTLTPKQFSRLPLVIEGESKEVRYAGNGFVVIRLKPTIYSYTANRCGEVEGSNILRLQATKIFLRVLQQAGIRHAYHEVNDQWILADLVMPSIVEFDKYGINPFRLPEKNYLMTIPVAPPIEVIVKRYHGGTSKHRYQGMDATLVRRSHPLFAGCQIRVDDPYPVPMIRFDWRNPFQDSQGKRVQDEPLSEDMADWYINVKKAKQTALRVYSALKDFLGRCDIICYDLCLFIAEDGETVYGEISQDCGRFRHFNLGSLDKDVWRAGGSSLQVLEKWQLLLDLIKYPRRD